MARQISLEHPSVVPLAGSAAFNALKQIRAAGFAVARTLDDALPADVFAFVPEALDLLQTNAVQTFCMYSSSRLAAVVGFLERPEEPTIAAVTMYGGFENTDELLLPLLQSTHNYSAWRTSMLDRGVATSVEVDGSDRLLAYQHLGYRAVDSFIGRALTEPMLNMQATYERLAGLCLPQL
jgi:hypothetical protein